MDAEPYKEPGWSYHVLTLGNPTLSQLQSHLDALGDDGWELVTSLTTVKTWINMTGNDLVFVFKKPGRGHTVGPERPTFEQDTHMMQLLADRGFSSEEAQDARRRLQRLGHWTPESVGAITGAWSALDKAGIKAWLAMPPR